MKAVILAGGLGTRLSEETALRPKPMVEIGRMPILWHIMRTYAAHGIDEFVILAGYRGHVIKEFFQNYATRRSSMRFELRSGATEPLEPIPEPWTVTVLDTGEDTMTGGRILRARRWIGEEPFLLTYGDGVSDVDVSAALAQHRRDRNQVTLTAVRPPGRFGALELTPDSNRIASFREKPDGAWINAGFFCVEPSVFDLIDDDATVWERDPLERIAEAGALGAYRHEGFWHPMDTLRDRLHLEALWDEGRAPWRID